MKNRKMIVLLVSFVFLVSACGILSKPSLEGAKKLAKDGKITEAVDMIEELIDQDDKNFELYLSLADIYLDEEEYRKVDRTLEDLSEIIVDNFDEDDDNVIDAIDDLVDFAKDLKREGEPVGDWFIDFVESSDIMELDLNLSKVLDSDEISSRLSTDNIEKDVTDTTSTTIDPNNKTIEAGYDFMSFTYGQVIDMFGSPDTEDAGLNTTELIYDDASYTFMFEVDGLSNASPVELVSVTGPDGRIHGHQPLIGENLYRLSEEYGFSQISYYSDTVLNAGSAFAKTTDGVYQYLLFVDDNDTITDCFIHRIDYSSATNFYAEDYLGYTLGELKDMYGTTYYVDANQGSYIVMYFGMPYYFMFDAVEDLSDNSVVMTVSLESGGKTMYNDPLMTITEEEFVNSYQNNYDSVEYDDLSDMAIVEGFGAYAVIIFDTSEYPNQVMVTADLNQFGFGDDGDVYIPQYGFDYLGYTYGELKSFIGEPVYVDDSGPYRYIEYDNVPYDFGFDMVDALSDDDYIYTVFIYFDEGGAFYEGLTYANMTYDLFMSEEAQYYTNIIWIEEDLRLEFEDDYSYYYLFYPDGANPTYMLIETK